MRRPPRVVLDTNIVLSALVFGGGASGRVRRAWQQRAIVPLVSAPTAQELVRALGYPKFRLSALQQEELLGDYLPYAEVVRIGRPPPQVPACRDPDDTAFLHLAESGKAQVLATGDRDLLVLAGQMPVPILTMEEFASTLAGGRLG